MGTNLILLALTFLAPSTGVESFLRDELVKRGARFEAIEVVIPRFAPQSAQSLEITQIQYDPVHRKTYFRLRVVLSSDACKRTFDVAVSGPILFPALIAGHDMAFGLEAAASDFIIDYRPPASLGPPVAQELAGRKTRRKILAGEVIHSEMFTAPAWVEAGRTANFMIDGEGFSLSMPVTPLEGGAPGQSIRVRAPETGRVFQAVVSGRDQVKLKGDKR